MSAGVLVGIALADFRERVRRPAYLVILAATVGLGYLAVPDPDGLWVIMDVAGYRGVYTSAYVGTVTALAGALWLALAGFYVVRGTITRDERTGVGQLLAATPLPAVGYLIGKFVSNLLVLASMAGVLAATAVVMQLARGESRTVEPLAVMAPFLLLALPVLALTATMALLFDAVRPLRAGVGNVGWFFVWMVTAIGGQSARAPLGGMGTAPVAESMGTSMAAQGVTPDAEFSLGLTKREQPLQTFDWAGLDLSWGLLADRSLLLALAIGLAVVPALWFSRFDPARGGGPREASAAPASAPPVPAATAVATTVAPPGTVVRPGWAFGRLFRGELRALGQSVSGWWWLVVAGCTAGGLVLPHPVATGPVLLAAWIWPVIVWSRLGTLRLEHGVDSLLSACPSPRRRLLAEWSAGLALTAVVGLAPLVRLIMAGDGYGVAAWAAGAVFIPSLALALGILTRSPRPFQAGYVALWFLVVNDIAAADYLGVVRVDGDPAGPAPWLVGGAAALLLGAAVAADTVRHRWR